MHPNEPLSCGGHALSKWPTPLAYVRGSTFKFYEWLDTTDSSKMPKGPAAIGISGISLRWGCRPVRWAMPTVVDIQIRDFDQTVILNPPHDLIRLGLSLGTAVRGSDPSGVTTAHMLEQMMLGYEKALVDEDPDLTRHRPKCVQVKMRQAIGRTWKNLAGERIEDARPTIPKGKKFLPLTKEERQEVEPDFCDGRST